MKPVREIVEGGWVLRDWLGKGAKITSQDTANARTAICVTCPENQGELWWEKKLKDPIAEMMRKQLELKNSMKLRVVDEDKSHVCRVCGCCVRLIVWRTDDQIRSHTPIEDAEKYPTWCWKRAVLTSG